MRELATQHLQSQSRERGKYSRQAHVLLFIQYRRLFSAALGDVLSLERVGSGLDIIGAWKTLAVPLDTVGHGRWGNGPADKALCAQHKDHSLDLGPN